MANSITIRVYEELNDFLHHTRRKKSFSMSFTGKRTIKDIIESLGVPHTEVDLILANGISTDFNYYPCDGDYISIYPVFESIDISELTRLRHAPLREIKFVLDVHLGTLARYLRLAGFDTSYRNNLEDSEIINISLAEHRIILTRDLPLLKNGQVTHGYFVRNTNPKKQMAEVTQRFDLKHRFNPFSRCLECNGLIERIEKIILTNQLKSPILSQFNEFYRCTSCGRVYWKGSHYERMSRIIEEMR